MVRSVRLLTAGVLIVAALSAAPKPGGEGFGVLDGKGQASPAPATHAHAAGDHVDLDGSRSRKSAGRSSETESGGSLSAAPVACQTAAQCSRALGDYLTDYYGYLPYPWKSRGPDDPRPFPPPAPDPAGPATAPRIVTADDVARFVPAQAALHTEPRGWAVVGVPANFWVAVTPATVDGELFDTPVQVRFTPTQYLWEYGDGQGAQTDTPGASWESSGQDRLTATPTSHVYRERAQLTASVRIGYTAQYRVGGGGWIGVVGAVVAPASPARVLVVTEATVLTAAR